MQKRLVQRGRPKGATTFDAAPAAAFGQTIRNTRMDKGISQEGLAHLAGVERSHMGKIERGEHQPNLGLIFRLARALDCAPGELLNMADALMKEAARIDEGDAK
jgi:transcriptional regulator with XRE-family HTH domain